MGFFDWLRGDRSNVQVLADELWMSGRAKYAGIAREVERALSGDDPPSAVLLLAHFPDVLA